MALIKCPECGYEISDKSSICVNCGCPINAHNIVTIRLPKDNGVIVKMKYQVTDSNGNVLSNGVSGEILTFSLDEPTTLTCSLVGKRYSGYKTKSIDYFPHGDARYEVVRRDKWFQSWVEISDESQVIREEPKKQDGKKGVSGFGIFFAIILALITVWAIMNPYSMPVWLQKIVFQIKALFEGKDSYTVLNWDKVLP